MIVEEKKFDLETKGVFESKRFEIRLNKKMYDMLSGSIYSDKILAIIREISCNAQDAHVAAKKADEPIIVHLPNSNEPYFSVRDNGVGLDKDEVFNLYTIYGDSTKTLSNDQVGCFGLGSKSPFSYTDNFTVIGRKDGIKHTYSLHTDDSGCPTVSLIGMKETNECDGFEVIVPVKLSDIPNFHTKATAFYEFFKPFPKITGKTITYNKRTDEIVGKDFIVYKESGGSYGQKRLLVMGNVVYPFTQYVTGIARDYSIVIFADIGDVNITVSRESLEANHKTNTFVEKRLKQIESVLLQKIVDKIDDAKTLNEKRKIYDSHAGILHNTNVKGKSFECKGYEAKITVNGKTYPAVPYLEKCRLNSSKKQYKQTLYIRDYPWNIVIDDCKNVVGRAKEKYGNNRFYIVDDTATIEKELEDMGLEYVRGSTLDKPKPKARGTGFSQHYYCFKFDSSQNSYNTKETNHFCKVEKEKVDVKNTKGYVIDGNCNSKEHDHWKNKLTNFTRILKKDTPTNEVIVMTTGKRLESLIKKGWKPMDDFLNKYKAKLQKAKNLYLMREVYHGLKCGFLAEPRYVNLVTKLGSKRVSEFVKKLKNLSKVITNNYSTITSFQNIFGELDPKEIAAHPLTKVDEKINERYKMLQYLSGVSQELVDFVIDTIKKRDKNEVQATNTNGTGNQNP